jgi:hypothetical protein
MVGVMMRVDQSIAGAAARQVLRCRKEGGAANASIAIQWSGPRMHAPLLIAELGTPGPPACVYA